MNLYKATLKHDNGTSNLTINASSKEQAIKSICKAEHCPASAIEQIKRIFQIEVTDTLSRIVKYFYDNIEQANKYSEHGTIFSFENGEAKYIKGGY